MKANTWRDHMSYQLSPSCRRLLIMIRLIKGYLEEMHMKKSTKYTIIVCVMALLSWYIAAGINPTNYEMIIASTAMIFAAVAIAMLMVKLGLCIAAKLNKSISSYRLFAVVNSIIGIGCVIFAIYDIRTDDGFMAGLLGYMILMFVVPFILLMLLIDYLFWKRKMKNDIHSDL